MAFKNLYVFILQEIYHPSQKIKLQISVLKGYAEWPEKYSPINLSLDKLCQLLSDTNSFCNECVYLMETLPKVHSDIKNYLNWLHNCNP